MIQRLNKRSNPVSDRILRRAEARRLEILRAAARVFRQRGFAAASMREIAAEADLSPGNLYHYFEGKVEILYFCQDRALDRMMGALEEARESGAPYSEQIAAIIETHLHCMLDEVDGSTAHLQVEALTDELRGAIIDKRDRYEKAIQQLVAAGVESGDFGPCDPVLVTRAILGALNWTTRWFRPEGHYSPAVVTQSMADYLVRGLIGSAQPAAALKTQAKTGA